MSIQYGEHAEDILREAEAAARAHVSPRTLIRWRAAGLRHAKRGRVIVYRWGDILAWLGLDTPAEPAPRPAVAPVQTPRPPRRGGRPRRTVAP